MSFTEDELQSFNTILEQRLSAQSQEMERIFNQRISALRHDMEERIEVTIDNMLAAQLLGIEQLLDQRFFHPKLDDMVAPTDEALPQLDTIEVQTDLTWEDLSDVLGKALDQRLSVLHEVTQSAIRNLEQELSGRLYSLREELLNGYTQVQGTSQSFDEMPGSMQEVLHGIDQLERIIESMQVAMTSNSALLSNRLYHHQQLPLERAHPTSRPHASPSNGVTAPLPIIRERYENPTSGSEGNDKSSNSE